MYKAHRHWKLVLCFWGFNAVIYKCCHILVSAYCSNPCLHPSYHVMWNYCPDWVPIREYTYTELDGSSLGTESTPVTVQAITHSFTLSCVALWPLKVMLNYSKKKGISRQCTIINCQHLGGLMKMSNRLDLASGTDPCFMETIVFPSMCCCLQASRSKWRVLHIRR